jgi:hypothetical protein
MRKAVEVEDIAKMRHEQGIEDVHLWQEIAGLNAGDFVKLTLLTSNRTSETVTVRITSVSGSAYRGKLIKKPISAALSDLKAGRLLTFTAGQIHSVVRKRDSLGYRGNSL